MKIAIIGGRRKSLAQFARIAADTGHELQSDELSGSGIAEVKRMIARADLVIILTDINSHTAMYVAKACAKQREAPTLITRQMGTSRFLTLLQAVERRQRLGWPWPTSEELPHARAGEDRPSKHRQEGAARRGQPSTALDVAFAW